MILQLAAIQYRSWLRRFASSLRNPRRLLSLFGVLFFVGLLILPNLLGVDSQNLDLPREALAVMCGMFYLMAVIFGFANRGPAFSAADVDVLFPAPLSRRQLLVYRLIMTYPKALLGVVFVFLILAWRVDNPWTFLAAFTLMQMTVINLQMAITVLMVGMRDSVIKRLRPWIQTLGFLSILGCVGLLGPVFAGMGGIQGWISNAMESPFWQVVLLPPLACVQTATAMTMSGVISGFLAQLIIFMVSIGFVLFPSIDFLEASLETSQKISTALKRVGRGGGGADFDSKGDRKSKRGHGFLFRGAGCIVYKNSIALSRSWRSLAFSVVLLGMIAAPTFVASAHGGGSSGPSLFPVVIILMVPIVLSAQCNFDFRREVDSLPFLKSLPLSSWSVVCAELFVPWCFCMGVQTVLLIASAFWFRDANLYVMQVAITVPLASMALFIVENISFFVFSPLGAHDGSRQSHTAGGGNFLVRIVGLIAVFVPPVLAAYFMFQWSESFTIAFGVFATVFVFVDMALLGILVRLFERREGFGLD